jgi:hypothetical protein
MPIRDLVWSLHPIGKTGNVEIVGDKREIQTARCFQADQKGARLRHCQSIPRYLDRNPNKSKLCNRTRCDFRLSQSTQPSEDSIVKLVLDETQSHKSIHVEEILHGNVESISSTSLLVKTGASGPRVNAGRPVRRLMIIFAFLERFLRGVSTTLPPFTSASSGSPGRRPSLRRIGPGRTTCPLVEIRVCMVRRSYHDTTHKASGCASADAQSVTVRRNAVGIRTAIQ